MRGFWALPVALRLAIASKHAFSVHDDILAFPQFQLQFPQDYILEDDALSLLDSRASDSPPLSSDSPNALQKQDPSNHLFPSGESSSSKQAHSYDVLTRPDGRRHLCRIPILDPETASLEADNSTLSSRRAEEAKELERANTRGWQLLSEMQGHCLYYWSGWWSYRYCFGDGVKQFHQLPPQPGMPAHPPVEDPNVPGFMLGLISAGEAVHGTGRMDWDDDEENDAKDMTAKKESDVAAVRANGSLETRGDERYLVQRLGGGSVCDMTGTDRWTEVQFHCSPTSTDHIGLIKETSTCKYLMVINTPRLCNDAAFLPPQRDSPNAVTCSPILNAEEVDEYKAQQLAAKEKMKTIGEGIGNPFAKDTTSKALPRVGNVVIGAHKHIPEGRELKKTAIVGGGKETLVDIIADSMGKLLNSDQLKKLGISNPKQVESLKKELDRIAGDKGWKLEVVDTARGREYRGIIGDDDDPQGQDQDAPVIEDTSGRVEYEKSKYREQQKQAGKQRNEDQAREARKEADGESRAPPKQARPNEAKQIILDGENLGDAGSVEEMMDIVRSHLRSPDEEEDGKGEGPEGGLQDGNRQNREDQQVAEELHRLQQDGDVMLIYDEGDPDDIPERDEL